MENRDIKETLLKEISKTEKLIQEYRELTRPVAPDVALGRISRMDAINNKSGTEAALRQAAGKLSNLKIVLSRVGSPEFGKCVKCKKEIPPGRILFRPESLHCVSCAQ